jgi:hypothetical protein
MIGTYVFEYLRKEDDKNSKYYNIICMPLLFYFIHRNLIALKYSSLTNNEYNRFMDATDNDIIEKFYEQGIDYNLLIHVLININIFNFKF